MVLALPHTPQTEGLVDAAAIARMKPSGVLVNGKAEHVPALLFRFTSFFHFFFFLLRRGRLQSASIGFTRLHSTTSVSLSAT